MRPVFNLTTGDTAPPLKVQLLDSVGRPQPLVGVQGVTFSMRERASKAARITDRAAVVLVPETDGWVRLDWQDGDVGAADAGLFFEGKFRVTFADGKRASYPKPGFITIAVDG